MKNIVYMLLIVSLFSGCSVYNELLKRDMKNEKIIEMTNKGEIANSLQTKSVIFATYLNGVDREDSENEIFYINTYISDDFAERSKRGLDNPFYSLELFDSKMQNPKKPLKITKLDENNASVKKYGIYSRWGENYIVEFEDIESDPIYLIYKNREYGETKMQFSLNPYEVAK